VANALSRLAEVETDTCAWPITQSSIITDEWFSYTVRGEVSDLYESTPHSGGYYHTAATYWANGVVNQLTGGAGYSAAYNLDGEGRVYSTAPSVGALNSTTYNAASQPTQVSFMSSDSDSFTYDPNTGRMTQYKFNVNGQSVIGNLTWNPVGTLASLAITDPFNSANAQTCNYSHDDLIRIASVNCGATKWQQNFSYDSFGNITKTVPTGGTGYSFQPNYSSGTNRMTLIGGSAPSYDANGNILNDFLHSYTWNAYGRPITIDGVSVTYDALGRMVEQNRSGVYAEMVYAPTGEKIEIMNGQSFTTAFVPLAGGAAAVYIPSASARFRHSDHLGSSRFVSNYNRTMYSDTAYAPFGEPYAQTGSTDLSFTGQNQDTVSNLYDFPAREYGIQGRWPSPDPAGLAATDLTDPQSWNRFSYVRNSPENLIDPFGLTTCDANGHNCFDSVTVTASGGSGRGSGGSGGSGGEGLPLIYRGGGGSGGLLSKIISTVCSALPSGRATSVSVAAGGIGSVSGSLDIVVNYTSGQTSVSATGGGGFGWNGGGSLTATTGLVFGLDGTNNGFKGQFKGANFYAPTPIPAVSAGGSITHGGGVTVVSVGVSGALAGKIGGGFSWTNTTNPLNVGKFTGFAPLDYVGYLLRRPCS
jgi:RHS repeat-associated protein